jgi:hypothetical protein
MRGSRAVLSFLLCGLTLDLPATVSPAPVEAQRWVFSATARETLTDNLFLIARDGPGESITGATLGLTYSRVEDRYSLSALGWANGQLYDRYSSYDGARFGLGVYGQRDFTRGLKGRLGLSYADGLNLGALYSSRVGLPQVDIKSGYVDGGLSYELSPGTTLGGSFDATGIRYHSEVLQSTARLPADSLTPPDVQVPLQPTPTPSPAVPGAPDASLEALDILALQSLRVSSLDYWTWHAGTDLSHEFSPTTRMDVALGYRRTGQEPRTFADGDQLEARVGLQHTIDAGAILFFTYDYQDNRFDSPVRTNSLVGGLSKELSSKVKIDFSLGGSYLDSADPAISGWTAIGGAGVSMRFDRAQLAARYERSRYQALVLGRNQTVDIVWASLGRVLTRRVYLAAYGSYRNARDPVSDLYSYTSATAGAFLTARIKKRGSAGLGYSYQHFGARGFPSADRSLVTFFVGYTRVGK